MEAITLDNDIPMMYVTASSFPAGIEEAHIRLRTLVPATAGTTYLGVSRPENGEIVYRAGTEETKPGAAAALHLDTLTLKKGNYISATIKDYKKDIESIDRTFRQLLAQPGKDPEGYCVEWYYNDTDVRCMVRLQ